MQYKNKDYIYLSSPHLTGDEKFYINQALEQNWVAPLGPNVDSFEKEISDYIKIGHSSVLSSGTAALHLALKVINIKPNDKVLCNSFTFAASANVIAYEKAEPIFIDSDEKYWTVDLSLLEHALKKNKFKAFICVNIYGQCPDYKQVKFLCKKYGVTLIEDAAESLGSKYNKKHSGSFGDLSILSFNGNKIITTSGGGALLSNNEKFIIHAKKLATQARENAIHYEHKELGYNYRLSNILAGIGRAQLNKIDDRVNARREIFNFYFKHLNSIPQINFLSENKNVFSNRWLTTLLLENNKQVLNIINKLEKNNIESRPLWKPMHMQPLYKECEYIMSDDNDVSRKLFENGICLPSGSSLSESDQNRIIDIIKNCLDV